MKITCPPGCLTDLPPLASEPFWFHSLNVRFRLGVPETVGLFAKALDQLGVPIQLPITNREVSLYGDALLLIAGSGTQIVVFRWDTGDITLLSAPEAGPTGHWWYAATEKEIICGRANLTGKTYVINRDTLALSVLPNAPDGGIGGGIVGGILLKAGTKGVAGDGPDMVVRWSARQSDPSSSGGPGGPFGFEDWTPSDVNASGEFLLDEGSVIRGGGSTQFGFIVWTDTRTYLLAPRNDLYVFTRSVIALRGLLASNCWTESDGRVWWYDQTRTLNVFDGGGVRQVPNPMRHASTELILNEELSLCFMTSDTENGEVLLHYPQQAGGFRELVYNHVDNAWYPFALGRIAMTDAHGDRPTVGINEQGSVFLYDLRQALLPSITFPFDPGVPLDEPAPAIQPEPYSFFLMTNWIASGNIALESLRSRNVIVPHTLTQVPGIDTSTDQLKVTVQSYGRMDLRETPVVDIQSRPVGQMLREMRAGGKALQFILAGDQIRTHIRFGPLDVEADVSGKR